MVEGKANIKKGALIWKAIPPPVKIGGGIVLAVGTFMLFRKRDKPPKLPVANAIFVDPALKGTGLSTMWSPTPLASELYQAMAGTNWSMMMGVGGETEDAWEKLDKVQDSSKIIAIYNEYNKIAEKNKDKMSLTQRIRDKAGSIYGSYKDDVLVKLDLLKLL